jgi:hypothetical protein
MGERKALHIGGIASGEMRACDAEMVEQRGQAILERAVFGVRCVCHGRSLFFASAG